MQSRIAEELRLRFHPVATIFTDEKPEEALQFQPGSRGCVISTLTAAAEGRTAVFDKQTSGCAGGMSGLCFERRRLQHLCDELRACVWKSWKRVRTRYHKLRGLGLPEEVVGYTANTRKGAWRIAASHPCNRG